MSFVKRETQNEHGQLSHDVAAAHWDELVHYNVQTTFFFIVLYESFFYRIGFYCAVFLLDILIYEMDEIFLNAYLEYFEN